MILGIQGIGRLMSMQRISVFIIKAFSLLKIAFLIVKPFVKLRFWVLFDLVAKGFLNNAIAKQSSEFLL